MNYKELTLRKINFEKGLLYFDIFNVYQKTGYIGSKENIGNLKVKINSTPDYNFSIFSNALNTLTSRYIKVNHVNEAIMQIKALFKDTNEKLNFDVKYI